MADTRPEHARVAVTAGLRGASWNAARMRAPFTTTPYPLTTEDRQLAMAFLFARGGEKRAVLAMHPRELMLTHYLVPDVLDAGWAFWAQQPRSIGNDLRLEHEIALHDVAAGVRQLRALGFEQIVLLGNSGGAGLLSLYNQQSQTSPASRISHTPAGRPTKLPEAALPVVDGMVLVSPHPGQGMLLLNALDASVTDERDPFSCDPALDPFSATNGYHAPPGSVRDTFSSSACRTIPVTTVPFFSSTALAGWSGLIVADGFRMSASTLSASRETRFVRSGPTAMPSPRIWWHVKHAASPK